MKESKFQTEFCKWLNRHGFYYFSVPNGMYADNIINVMNMKRQGMRDGVSDLIVLRPNGRCLFLELKNETGKQRKEQLVFQTVVENLGFEYRLIRPSRDKKYWKELYKWLD